MTKTIVAAVLSLLTWGRLALAADAPPADPAIAAAGIGQPLPPFTAQTIKFAGDKQEAAAFDSQQVGKAVAYVIVGTSCPTTALYIERFKQLEQTYGPKGVEFVYVYPNRNDTSEAKLAFHKSHGFKGSMIDDQEARVAKLLKGQHTSEIILVDKKVTILYRGAADDAKDAAAVKIRYMANALDEHLAGKPITTPVSQVFA